MMGQFRWRKLGVLGRRDRKIWQVMSVSGVLERILAGAGGHPNGPPHRGREIAQPRVLDSTPPGVPPISSLFGGADDFGVLLGGVDNLVVRVEK
jgi:hypothetical protein